MRSSSFAAAAAGAGSDSWCPNNTFHSIAIAVTVRVRSTPVRVPVRQRPDVSNGLFHLQDALHARPSHRRLSAPRRTAR